MINFTNCCALLMIVGFVSSQSCLFDFERDEELNDFDTSCGNPNLLIIDKPTTLEPPEPIGDRGLTTKLGTESCLTSRAKIAMTTAQIIKVTYFTKREAWSDDGNLEIKLDCMSITSQKIEWKLLEAFKLEPPDAYPDGIWVVAISPPFSIHEGSECTVQMVLYKNNNFEIYVDKIEIVDPISSPEECYKVERPSTSTTVTDENTFSTTDSPLSTNDPTSSTDDPTSSTTGSTSPTSDPTSSTNGEVSTGATTEDDEVTSENSSSSTISQQPPQTGPSAGYPEFSFYFIVIIIAVSGAMSLISCLLCMFIIRRRKLNEKASKNKRWQHRSKVIYS